MHHNFGREVTTYMVMYGVYIRFWPTLLFWLGHIHEAAKQPVCLRRHQLFEWHCHHLNVLVFKKRIHLIRYFKKTFIPFNQPTRISRKVLQQRAVPWLFCNTSVTPNPWNTSHGSLALSNILLYLFTRPLKQIRSRLALSETPAPFFYLLTGPIKQVQQQRCLILSTSTFSCYSHNH